MKITFLGTGTSVGVPVIGCECAVCKSADSHNRRRRSSLHIESAGVHITVDTPPDFRDQALECKIPRVDALLFTHSHADHIFGFDDIRRFNTIQDGIIPAYGSEETLSDLKRIFNYVGREKVQDLFRPLIEFREISGPFSVGEVHVEPLPVVHEPKETLGFLFESEGRTLGYIPDCHEMADDLVAKLEGVDVMILDALRRRPHPTHLTLSDSVALLQRIHAGRSYIIHMCHDLDHEETQKELPDTVFVSHDGLTVEW